MSSPTVPPFTDGTKEFGLHYASDASPSDTAKGITGGVGMLAGGAVDTISQRQHLASPDVHACELSVTSDRLLRNSKLLHPTNCVSLYSRHRTEHSLSR